MKNFIPLTIEAKGKTFDEALFNGLLEAGLAIDEVTFEVIQEGTNGFMGIGAKPFILKLTARPTDFDMEEKKPSRPAAQDRPAQDRPAQDRPAQDRPAQARPAQDRPAQDRPAQARPAQDRPAQARPAQARPAQARPAQARPAQERRESLRPAPERPRAEAPRAERREERPRRERPAAVLIRDDTDYSRYVPGQSKCPGADFLLGLLEGMGVKAELEYYEAPNAIRLKIQSDSMGILIGHRGETLDSLQYLTGLVVNRERAEYCRVTLDTENYRVKREETLNRLARKIAFQVKSTGQPVTLEPMNPYERRVLHSALQNNAYVTTFSQGEEPNRCVVIAPRR